MKCPSCAGELKMTDRQGVEIDYCPGCRGVWLDRGELDKIVERSSRFQPLQEMQREDEREDYPRSRRKNDDDDDRQPRKRSFLGELFDF